MEKAKLIVSEKQKKTRKRFNRNAISSSAGTYVHRAHKRMLKEAHDKNKAILINISMRIPPKYFIKCFGKLIQITPMEAAMLKRTTKIIEK